MRIHALAVLMAFVSAAFGDEVRISHMDSDLVIGGSGIACGTLGPPAGSLEISYWNSYTLSNFGITSDIRVRRIEFGIEQLSLPTMDEVTIGVNLYLDDPQSRPTIGLPLIASTDITLGEMELAIVSVDIDAMFPTDKSLILEISAPSLYDVATGPIGDVFIPGSNGFGMTAETYISSIPCGYFEPEVVSPFGWPWGMVVTVIGETICHADLDEDGELTIFDFLLFQNLFDAGDPRADFDGDGALTVFDFLEFQNRFDLGC